MSHIGNARFVRRTHITLAVMFLTSPFVIWGTLQGLHNLNDDAISWTASNLASRHDLDWFTKHFGSQNAVLVSWPGATLDDARLDQFAQAVRDLIANDGDHNGPFLPRGHNRPGSLSRSDLRTAQLFSSAGDKSFDGNVRRPRRQSELCGGRFIG